jgi:fructoselysine-6-P-deglycase FrlB-like protein
MRSGDVQLDDLRRVPEWVDAALSRLEEDIEDLAERYFFMTRAVTVGRGLNYANALEFGLKLMETCYVVTERFSAADLMHGPDRAGGARVSRIRFRARRRHLAVHFRRARSSAGAESRNADHHR